MTNTSHGTEFGICSDDTYILEGDLWSVAEAEKALAQYDADDEARICLVCPVCRAQEQGECECECECEEGASA